MAMTGSKQPIAIENGLRLKLARNNTGANYLYIRLNAMDTYDLEFRSIRMSRKAEKGYTDVVKESFEGAYDNMLESLFKSATGLETRLF